MPDPTAEEMAPIFRAYGHAVYTCHLLEDALGLLLSVIDEERRRQNLPPRPSPIDPRSQKTIGVLFAEVRAIEYLTAPEIKQIQDAARVRNLLIHSYWDERKLQAMLTPTGRAWIVEDLEKKRIQLRDADRLVTKFVNSYLARYGVSVESLSAHVFDEYVPDDGPPDAVLH
ncbi:MAG: hypothetical protein AABM33_12060 [Pseudomonadota bacterium]